MGFWNKWFISKNVEERAEPSAGGLDDLLLQSGSAAREVTKEDVLNIPAVASCVDLIASTIASLPIKLYKEGQGATTEEIKNDPRVKLLNDDTKAYLNGHSFKYKLVEDYLLEGNGYAYIKRKRNLVESLHYVEASVINVQMNVDPIFKSYDLKVQGKSYNEYDFIKLARKTTNGITGKGIIKEHKKVLSVAFNTLVFEDTLVTTGGNKKGFLKSPRKLATDAINALKAAWASLYKNTGENVVVLNEGLEFQEVSITSVEMQLNENKRTNADEIKRIFNVYEGLDEKTIKAAILPTIAAFEAAINQDLLLPSEKEGSFYFAFDIKNLMKGDIEKRYKAYETAIKSGFMQIDEVRFEEDLAPLGLNFIKLGLQDVLYDPKTQQIYTPNTNKTTIVGGSNQDNPAEGGENIED